nr:DUF6230 family protein [uncultured Actinoplanes sp.]
MKDAQGAPAYGRTNWRRFAIAAAIPAVAAVGVMTGVAQGAIPANFVVSGTPFKLSADRLEGEGFTQYSGSVQAAANGDKGLDGRKMLAVSGIASADIYNLCQTVSVGPVVLRIEAGKDENNPVHADDLLIGMTELSGDATFKNIDIGVDAAHLSKDKSDTQPADNKKHGDSGGFGQEADHVTITGLKQTAYSTSATTFKLSGMSLKLFWLDGKPCF